MRVHTRDALPIERYLIRLWDPPLNTADSTSAFRRFTRHAPESSPSRRNRPPPALRHARLMGPGSLGATSRPPVSRRSRFAGLVARSPTRQRFVTYTLIQHPPLLPKRYICLYACLRHCAIERIRNVLVARDCPSDGVDVTAHSLVSRDFGHVDITLRTHSTCVSGSLRALGRSLRSTMCTLSADSVRKLHFTDRETGVIMKKVAYGTPPYDRPSLVRAHPSLLLWIFTHANHLKRRLRPAVQRKVLHILKAQHRAPPVRSLMLKLPANLYNMQPIRLHLDHLISQTILPDWLQKYVKRNVRIVTTKRESIYDIMGNLIPTVKSLTLVPPSCSCERIVHVTGLSASDMQLPSPPGAPRATRPRSSATVRCW